MILGIASALVIRELNADLGQKTLALASERLGQSFPGLVPWMCMVCLTDAPVADTSIFFEQYARGELLTSPESLRRISRFLKSDGQPIEIGAVGPQSGLDSDQWFSVIKDPAAEEPKWIGCYESAREMLMESDEFFRAIFYDLIHFVVPIKAPGKFGFSTHLARGAVFLTPPDPQHSEVTLAIDLAHELGHQAMMVFQSADPLLASPLDQPVWSAIRKNFRPAVQCMQAVSAMGYMTLFMRSALKRVRLDMAETVYLGESHSAMVEDLRATLAGLRESCQFTPLGNNLIREFHQLAEES